MGWLIALAVILALSFLPLGVSIAYDEEGPRARVIAGPVKLQVYPANKNSNKQPKPKKEKKKQEPGQKKSGGSSKGGSLSDFYPFLELVFELLTDFRRKLRVDFLQLRILLAGGDPADLALNYGKAWAALGNLWPRLETWFVIKKRDVEVLCDFEGGSTAIIARLDLSITLGRLLSMGLRHGIRGIKEFMKFRKKRNGGTTV